MAVFGNIKINVDASELDAALVKLENAARLMDGASFSDGWRVFWRTFDRPWSFVAGFSAAAMVVATIGMCTDRVALWLIHLVR